MSSKHKVNDEILFYENKKENSNERILLRGKIEKIFFSDFLNKWIYLVAVRLNGNITACDIKLKVLQEDIYMATDNCFKPIFNKFVKGQLATFKGSGVLPQDVTYEGVVTNIERIGTDFYYDVNFTLLDCENQLRLWHYGGLKGELLSENNSPINLSFNLDDKIWYCPDDKHQYAGKVVYYRYSESDNAILYSIVTNQITAVEDEYVLNIPVNQLKVYKTG